MAIEFNMVITDEGVDRAREASANANWHLIPKRYAISATAGELSTSRDYTSMLSTWTTNTMSSQVSGTNAIQNNVVVRGDAANIDRQIGEIYFIYTNESNEEFLFAIAQPSSTLMFTPGVQQNYIFVFKLNNTNVADIVQINYSFAEDITDHNNDPDAHPYLLARDGSRTATGVLEYATVQSFTTPRDIVDKEYVDNIKSYVDVEVPKAVPIGAILPWMSTKTTYPDGFLKCNGATISRSDYSDLFDAIGTTYGAGNGSTTFKIPDLRGCFLRGDGTQNGYSGAALGSYQNPALPNITGGPITADNRSGIGNYGAIRLTSITGGGFNWDGGNNYRNYYFNASWSNTIYQDGINEVRPFNKSCQYIIKAR